jgi:hypothetical protein
MLNALRAQFKRRFGDLLTFDDILTNSLKHSLMLTVSHPYFKLRWLTNSGDKKIAGALFLAIATFYCEIGGQKPTYSAILPTQSSQFAQMGNIIARPGACGELEKKNVYISY